MITDPVYYHIAFLLSDNGLGTLGSDLFGGELGQADEQTLVLEGVGVPSDLKEVYENPGFQIICRGKKKGRDVDVYRTAKGVYDFLIQQSECTEIQGVSYTGFEPSTNLAPLGKDENERFLYSMNFTTFRNAL